jgi:hypothetical protein
MSDIKISQLTAATSLHPDAIVPVIQTDPNDGVVKNFSARASQFATGVQLLGKLTGANMNLANSATIDYTGHTGFAFQPGDTLTDSTGATAVITADSGTALSVSSLDLSSGAFTSASTISGSIGQISYGSVTGTFQNESITGATSHATATITASGTSALTITAITGSFTDGETITGTTSGATATITSYSAPGSASVTAYTFISGDQPITLSGGSGYIVTDVVITNASTSLTTANGGAIYSGVDMSGYQIATMPNGFGTLVSAPNYINNVAGVGIGYSGGTFTAGGSSSNSVEPIISSSPVFFSLTIAQGEIATADIYVYGYVVY